MFAGLSGGPRPGVHSSSKPVPHSYDYAAILVQAKPSQLAPPARGEVQMFSALHPQLAHHCKSAEVVLNSRARVEIVEGARSVRQNC